MADALVPAMACQELVELVTDYLDEALDADTRQRFVAHLHACSACDSYLEQIRFTIATSGRLRRADLPPGVREGLMAAFRQAHAG